MLKVKGSMIIDYARIIRANKDKDWDQYLTPEDWEVVKGQVLPSNWYSYDTYRRIAFAVFKLVANSNLETARGFGRFNMKNLLDIYKHILVPGDPAGSINKWALLRRNFFSGEEIQAETDKIGDKEIIYRFKAPPEETEEERLVAFAHALSGQLEELVEQAGGKNPKSEIIKEADRQYAIRLKWE